MVPLQKLIAEGLVPQNAGIGGQVAYGNYFVCYWDWLASTDIILNGRKIFSAEDFNNIYLQVETGNRGGKEIKTFERISVKMNVDETENTTGKLYNQATVRRARKILQDYFVEKIPCCQRIRFQFQSPKDNVEHAYWLTICRVYYDETNYKERITATQKAFDALKP